VYEYNCMLLDVECVIFSTPTGFYLRLIRCFLDIAEPAKPAIAEAAKSAFR
jgi:hypothetical protein